MSPRELLSLLEQARLELVSCTLNDDELKILVDKLYTTSLELKAEVDKLASEQRAKRRTYKPFDADSELDRLTLISVRDGLEEVQRYAPFLRKHYLKAALNAKQEYGKTYPFRYGYLEAAYSIRHLLKRGLFVAATA